MHRRSISTYSNLVICFVVGAVLLAMTLCFLLGAFFYTYYSKYQQIQQTAVLLADSASSPQGVDLVADQVSELLSQDPIIESIVFYSIEQPLEESKSSVSDLMNALTGDVININQPVISPYISDKEDAESVENSLVGYISITMDIAELRSTWMNYFRWYLVLVLVAYSLCVAWIYGRLNIPMRQMKDLAMAADDIIKNPNLLQMPNLRHNRQYTEILHIHQGFTTLLRRLESMSEKLQSIEDYESQLHNKDLSLDIQRNSFQSMITHELKTSLNAIFGGLQLLDNQYLTEEQIDAVSIIRKGSHQLNFTIEQIIQLNRLEKGLVGINLAELQPLQLISDLVAEYEPIAKQKNIQLISDITHVYYTLEGDMPKIHTILSALIDNAIKFTEQGEITIESHLSHFEKHTRWTVNVIDTGIGIEPRYFEDIFSPFFQVDPSINRQFEGVGVGLALAKQIARLIDADILVESSLGKGSTFSLVMHLKDWQHAQNHQLLSGVSVISYRYEQISSQQTTLEKYGAKVYLQHDMQYVVDMMNTAIYDVLNVGKDVSPANAKQLAIQVRHAEQTHRSLIVYVYDAEKHTHLDVAELNAAGVDHCMPSHAEPKELAMYIKDWMNV